MLAVDYTRRAESIVEREEAEARRARLHAAETAFETARARREEIERRRDAELKPLKEKQRKYNRLMGALKGMLDRLDERMREVELRSAPEWMEADDACMATHDAWTEELSR